MDVYHIIPFEYWQLILTFGKTDIAGGIGIIEVLGSIQSTFKAGAGGVEGNFDSPVRKVVEISISGVYQMSVTQPGALHLTPAK